MAQQLKDACEVGRAKGLQQGHTVTVLAIAAAMRLLVMATVLKHYPAQWLFTRGIEMGLLAKSLLAGQGLSSPFGGSTGPTAFIAPVYPLLVALVFKIFGSFTTTSAIVVMLAQTALNLVTIWLMMHVARQLFNQATATVAGLIWAVSLPLIWMPTIFWETSLSCCLLMGLLALVLRYSALEKLTPIHWMKLGAYCGFAALVNPALLLALVAISLWLVFQTRERAAWWPMLAALTFALVFAPWPIRNAKVFHAFIPLRTTVGFELWMGNHAGADGFLDETLFPMYNRAELADYVARGEVAYSEHKAELAKEYVAAHPGTFAGMTAVRAKRFWSGTGSRNGSKLFAMHAMFTTVFGFGGLWLMARSKRYALAILFALPIALFPLPYLITHAEFRYRLILDPLLAVFSGYGVTELLGYLKRAQDQGEEQTAAVYGSTDGDDGTDDLTTELVAMEEIAARDQAAQDGERRSARLRVAPILSVALVLRGLAAALMFRVDPRAWFYNQASELSCLAHSVLSGQGLSSPFGGSTGASAFLAPGYPLLVALVYRFFGADSLRAAWVLTGLQVGFGVAIVWMVMVVAQRVFGNRTARIAGVLCAVSPTMMWLPTLFWETSLSTLLLIGILAFALRCIDVPQPSQWVAIGAYCAFAMFINPSLLVTFAGVVAWAGYKTRGVSLRAPLLAAITCALLFSVWPIRNAIALHAFVPLRSNLGYELWQGNRQGSEGLFVPSIYLNQNREEFGRYSELGELAYMHEKSAIAVAAIKADPMRFVRLSLKRAAIFWTALGGHQFSWVVVGEITLTSLLGIAGLIAALRRRIPGAQLLLIPFLLFPLPYYLTHPDFRFRLLLEPVALLLTAWLLEQGWASVELRRAEPIPK